MGAPRDRTKRFMSRRVAYDSKQIRHRDEYRCYICGQKTHRPTKNTDPKKDRILEHVVPLSLGGDDAPWNVRNACRECDAAKGSDPDKVNIFALLPGYEFPPLPPKAKRVRPRVDPAAQIEERVRLEGEDPLEHITSRAELHAWWNRNIT